MAQMSRKLRSFEGGLIAFWCPGCNSAHAVNTSDRFPRWHYNGNAEKPTLTPSLIQRTGHFMSSHRPGDECWCDFNRNHPRFTGPRPICVSCHCIVTDGKIQFLSDSSHALAGQTVDLPDWPEDTT